MVCAWDSRVNWSLQLDEARDPGGLIGEVTGVGLDEALAGDRHDLAQSGHVDAEHVLHLHEVHAVAHAEAAQHHIHELALLSLAGDVDRRVEGVRAPLEGVRATAHGILALEQEHLAPQL